jgi:hypothetical protein
VTLVINPDLLGSGANVKPLLDRLTILLNDLLKEPIDADALKRTAHHD